MSISVILWFTLMGFTFLIWVFVWFRALHELKGVSDKRRADENAGYFRSLGIVVEVFAEFATDPERRQRRWQVGFLTVILFAIILAGMVLLPLPF